MAVNSSGEDGARFQKEYNNSPLLKDNHEPTNFINNCIFPLLLRRQSSSAIIYSKTAEKLHLLAFEILHPPK